MGDLCRRKDVEDGWRRPDEDREEVRRTGLERLKWFVVAVL